MTGEKFRLTQLSSMGGCASKFSPGKLAEVLQHLKVATGQDAQEDENLLVGFGTSDDAGVYRIAPDYALIQTLDFFTPIVDDPYTFGAIAATNALSDVYAMGGTPLTGMDIACFSPGVPSEILAEILRGGYEKIREAGAVLVGGHTVSDKEVKFGVSVTGHIHPDNVMTNAGAKAGDVLILTKKIGAGILTTAFKHDAIAEDGLAQACASMTTLNRGASLAMQAVGAHACTDVTGFGLLGHLAEMMIGSNTACRLHADAVPFFDGVFDLIGKEEVPGGAYNNQKHFGQWVAFSPSVPEPMQIALFDPQTSGGLLIAVESGKADALVQALRDAKTPEAVVLGEVVPAEPGNPHIFVQ